TRSSERRSPRPRRNRRSSRRSPRLAPGRRRHRSPLARSRASPDSAPMSKLTGSRKALQFTESVIREMTRLCQAHGGVNLSQGFPDFPAPAAVKQPACAPINADVNQYAVTWGARPLREAIARAFTERHGVDVIADEQVTV